MRRYLTLLLVIPVALIGAGCERGGEGASLKDLEPTEVPAAEEEEESTQETPDADADPQTGKPEVIPNRKGRAAYTELNRITGDTASHVDRALLRNTSETFGADKKWHLRSSSEVYFDRGLGYVAQGKTSFLVKGRSYRRVSYGFQSTKGYCWEDKKATRSAAKQISAFLNFRRVMPEGDNRLTLVGNPDAPSLLWTQYYTGSSNSTTRGKIFRDAEGRITRMFVHDVKRGRRETMWLNYNPPAREAVAPTPPCDFKL